MFLEIGDLRNSIETNDPFNIDVRTSGAYALVEPVGGNLDRIERIDSCDANMKAHQASHLVYYDRKRRNGSGDNMLHLIHVEDIVSPCIGVQDLKVERIGGLVVPTDYWIFVKPRKEWPSILIQIAREFNSEDNVVGEDGEEAEDGEETEDGEEAADSEDDLSD
jgi:hypothetical protein